MNRKKRTLNSHAVSGSELLPFLIICAAFFIGGFSGILFAQFVKGTGADELHQFLTCYFDRCLEDVIHPSFAMVAWQYFKFILPVFLFSFTAMGLLGLPILMAVKGFSFTFSISCLSRFLGVAGILPAFFLYGLVAIIWIPVFFILATKGMHGALCFLKRDIGESKTELPHDTNFFLCWAICLAAVLFCIVFEFWVVPHLMSAIVKIVVNF